MNKIFNEAGFLTEEGKEVTYEYKKMVNNLLSYAKSKQEILIIGSILHNIIGTESLNLTIESNEKDIICIE